MGYFGAIANPSTASVKSDAVAAADHLVRWRKKTSAK
jgi:hypothetical protein